MATLLYIAPTHSAQTFPTTAKLHASAYRPQAILPALLEAVRNGDQAAVQSLVDAEADPNLQDRDGLTPLMRAAGFESGVQILLKHGASLPTESQWSAVMRRDPNLPAIQDPALPAYQIEAAKQLIDRNRNIVQERARAAGEYFEAEGMPVDVAGLIQQIGVEGLPLERKKPVPEEEQEEQ